MSTMTSTNGVRRHSAVAERLESLRKLIDELHRLPRGEEYEARRRELRDAIAYEVFSLLDEVNMED